MIIVLNGHSNSGEGQRHRETRSERELERERGRERIHKSEWRGGGCREGERDEAQRERIREGVRLIYISAYLVCSGFVVG